MPRPQHMSPHLLQTILQQLRDQWVTCMGRRCIICGAHTTNTARFPLCSACAIILTPYNKSCCPKCGLPFRAEQASNTPCSECLSSPPLWQNFFFHNLYDGPLREVLLRLKFHNGLEFAPLIGTLLKERVDTAYTQKALSPKPHTPPNNPHSIQPGLSDTEVSPLPDVLIPVPLHTTRLTKRGFNQSVEILRPLASHWKVPLLANGVVRKLATAPQMSLRVKERKNNLRGAFAVLQKNIPLIYGKHILLGDDIMTTGATLRQICHVLLQSGAARVDVVVVARTDKN